MKVVTSTDEYTIYQRRDGRYAVIDGDKKPVNGDAKVTILLEHDLIKAAAPKPPEPEAAEPEASADADSAGDAEEEGTEEGSAEEGEESEEEPKEEEPKEE